MAKLCCSLHVNECRQIYAVLNGTIHMRCLALNTCQLVSKILVAMFANFLEVLGESHGEVCVQIEHERLKLGL